MKNHSEVHCSLKDDSLAKESQKIMIKGVIMVLLRTYVTLLFVYVIFVQMNMHTLRLCHRVSLLFFNCFAIMLLF